MTVLALIWDRVPCVPTAWARLHRPSVTVSCLPHLPRGAAGSSDTWLAASGFYVASGVQAQVARLHNKCSTHWANSSAVCHLSVCLSICLFLVVPTTENLTHVVNFLSLLDTFLIGYSAFDDENSSEHGLGVRRHMCAKVMMVLGPFNASQWLYSMAIEEVSFLVKLDNSLWLWGSVDAQIFRHGFTDAHPWLGTVTEPRRTQYGNSAKTH